MAETLQEVDPPVAAARISASGRLLTIFVHRASECLTDHAPHGEGLICFSLLDGLARRGHRIFAYANHVAIQNPPVGLTVKTATHRVPANSLAPYEHSWRAERWMRRLARTEAIDLVWRMNPTGTTCPYPPPTLGRPLVVGPLYYPWPVDPNRPAATGRPRLGVGIGPLVRRVSERGWRRTLSAASLVLCATSPHAAEIGRQYPKIRAEPLPLIVDPPPDLNSKSRVRNEQPVLAFVGHLMPNKNPAVFLDAVGLLRRRGLDATALVIGDGPNRAALEARCRSDWIGGAVRFVGRVPNPEVYRLVGGADFLVSTSLGEPYGRNIAEAMSVGTVPACHRSGGPADFITPGVDGLLIDRLDPAAYADAIASVCADPESWHRLSNGAQSSASDWTSGRVLDRLEVMLAEVIDDHDDGADHLARGRNR